MLEQDCVLLLRLCCQSCFNLIVDKQEVPQIVFEEGIGDEKQGFLKTMDRGGLFDLTDLVFVLSLHTWDFFSAVIQSKRQEILLESNNAKDSFTMAFESVLEDEPEAESIINQNCQDGHSFSPLCKKIVQCLFNIFAKNHKGDLNGHIHSKKRCKFDSYGSAQSKALKLQSDQYAKNWQH